MSVQSFENIRSVTCKAHYLTNNWTTPQIVELGTVTRAPFKFFWNVAGIPNQLGSGASIIAEAEMRDGQIVIRKLDGIFLLHQPITRPSLEATYRSELMPLAAKSIDLSNDANDSKGTATIEWNEDGLLFHVAVHDPFYSIALPPEKLSKIKVEIMIDVHQRRDLYVSPRIYMLAIPVRGAAVYSYTQAHLTPAGKLEVTHSTIPSQLKPTVTNTELSGYSVFCQVPWKELGDRKPNIFDCNLSASILDRTGNVQVLSWTGHDKALYSPVTWGEVHLGSKPLLANKVIVWVFCLLIGIGTGVVGGLLYRMSKRISSPANRREQSAENERLCSSIKQAVHEQVTRKDFSIEEVAQTLAIPASTINRLIKHSEGESFNSYLIRSRIEIAKERLRSSHSSESAIAVSCGFADAHEMESHFKKMYTTTPQRYREQHQVT